MTSASMVFCAIVLVAWLQGYATPAFARTVAGDAFSAAMPLLGVLVVARFAALRMPSRRRLVDRVHAAVQGLLLATSFGWWWVEPHATLTALFSGSLAAMAWQAVFGAAAGLLLALAAERTSNETVAREIALGALVAFLAVGGRLYRGFDDVEANARATAAAAIVAGTITIAFALWLLLRRRTTLAAAVPALAPAAAAIALFAAPAKPGAATEASTRDSVLLVVIDTLRADIADGRFAGAPDAMPQLAKIAAQGTRFTQAASPAPWTLPATVSLLSGWNPHRHRYGRSASDWEVLRGDPSAMYLAGALRDAGYLAASFVHNPYLRPYFGFADGFYTMRPYHGRAIDGIALALDWIASHTATSTFTMLHLMDPHWPYDAPPGFGEPRRPCASCDSLFELGYRPSAGDTREEVERRYVAEVRYTDALLGRFYDTLASAGVLENTWLIVTSDHGEEFWEHGRFLHGHSLFDELLRVPLVVVPPRRAKEAARGPRVEQQVRLEDVAATVLEIAGLDPKLAPDGASLLPLLRGAREPRPRTSIGGYLKSPTDLAWSVRELPWKAVYGPGANALFDVVADPGEQRSLLPASPSPAASRTNEEIVYALMTFAPSTAGLSTAREPEKPTGAVPDADTRKQLESLGYAQ